MQTIHGSSKEHGFQEFEKHIHRHFLLLWIAANILALPLGWAASQVIQSPFGEWAYGAIVIALLASAFRYRSKPVAGWVIWWNMCGLITGFELPLRASITNPIQAMALIAVLMLALVISWSVILSPFGLIWFMKVFIEPHPHEPPRRQVLVRYLKSGVKVILVWCAVFIGGAALGVALGLGSRALGELYGWTATLEFNLGVRAASGVIGGTITGLAMMSELRPKSWFFRRFRA